MQVLAPRFLLTIDTEGDNLWAAPKQITTRNAQFLPRFQTLCERFGFLPTYLTNYEMAICPDFQSFARDGLQRKTLEIGMHLHAWNSPPIEPLTDNDDKYMPFLIEYPEAQMRDKIAYMTELLESTFETKMTSHRAGRWSFNATYARILIEHSYTVDCSVTPHVSWRDNLGDPTQKGGTDFSLAPETPYFLDENDVCKAGNSSLLEVPMTVMRGASKLSPLVTKTLPMGSLPRRVLNKITEIEPVWLRPNGANLKQMLSVVERARKEKRPYLEWMLHSSEFMPGGSPTFQTEADIDRLFSHLETLFEAIAPHFSGATLSQFAREWKQSRS